MPTEEVRKEARITLSLAATVLVGKSRGTYERCGCTHYLSADLGPIYRTCHVRSIAFLELHEVHSGGKSLLYIKVSDGMKVSCATCISKVLRERH